MLNWRDVTKNVPNKKTMMKSTAAWSCACALFILLGSCQTIPNAQDNTKRTPAAPVTKAGASAIKETKAPPQEEATQGRTYAITQTVEHSSIQFRVEASRRSTTVPKLAPKRINDGKKREWRMFYITMRNQGSQPLLPSQHPTFTLLTPQGQEHPENSDFVKLANTHGNYSPNSAIAPNSTVSKPVGFYVPKDEHYELAVHVPSKQQGHPGTTFYFNLKTDD